MSARSVLASLVGLAVLIGFDSLFKEELIKFTISKDGIEHMQQITPIWIRKVSQVQTEMSAGKEMLAAIYLSFIWGTRPKFFYFMTMLTLDKLYISYFKLAYGEPRPYMIDGDIVSYTCSKAFGNPSGHSSGAFLAVIVVFLDTFHGRTLDFNEPLFFKSWSRTICFLFGLYWVLTIPFTRYLLGAHSLDQILYGSSLGIWGGLSLHFVVRDHFIRHIQIVTAKNAEE